MTLLEMSEKLERLAERLPGPLRKAFLREITPVKDLFLRQRAPKLLILGARTVQKENLINALFGCTVALPDPSEAGTGSWQRLSLAGRGTLQFLDARNPANLTRSKSAMGVELPDLVIFLQGNAEGILPEEANAAEAVLQFIEERHDAQFPVIGTLVGNVSEERKQGSKEADALQGWLRSRLHLERGLIRTIALSLEEGLPPPDGKIEHRGSSEELAELITASLPDDAKLEMARLSGARSAQIHIAKILTRSFSAISGAIGAQPIPLADFPILTSLQATMVGGIMYISGREVTPKLAGEFIAALGANISAGLVLREGARALLKFFPGWGNAISGAIASAGTYAIGKAAASYFIEGASLPAARKLFLRGSKSAIEKKRTGQ